MNATQSLNQASRNVSETASAVAGATKNAIFAGLGLVAVAQEEAVKFYNTLVREGENVETGRARTLTARTYQDASHEARKVKVDVVEAVEQVDEEATKAARRIDYSSKAFEDRVVKTVTTVLQRMNVPTREDLDALKRAVERLDKKTAELRAA